MTKGCAKIRYLTRTMEKNQQFSTPVFFRCRFLKFDDEHCSITSFEKTLLFFCGGFFGVKTLLLKIMQSGKALDSRGVCVHKNFNSINIHSSTSSTVF